MYQVRTSLSREETRHIRVKCRWDFVCSVPTPSPGLPLPGVPAAHTAAETKHYALISNPTWERSLLDLVPS